jgi:hypothetical protein
MADNLTIKDGTGTTKTVRALDQAGIFVPVQAGYDATIDAVKVAVEDGTGQPISSTLVGSKRSLDVMLLSGGTVGAAAPTNANLLAGTDGTNLRAFSTDTNGRVNVNIETASGVATAANQTTGNTSLSTVVTNTAATKTSVDTMSAKLPAALGPAAPSASVAITAPNDVTVTGPSAQSVINTDLLTGTVSGWYDAANFHAVAVQIIASAGISAGAVIFEQTNDTTLAASGSTLPAQEPAVVASSSLLAAVTIAASTTRLFIAPITARYVRCRISTAFVGGTVQAVGVFSQSALALTQVQALNPTAANLAVTASIAATQTLATVSTVTSANLGLPSSIADVASAALTTTTTTAALTPTFGVSYEVNIPVTAVTGTTPTMDVDVEESDDGGTNWYKVYSFPRITAIGIYRSPRLAFNGNRVRYAQTVTGTSPSFTRAINRLQINDGADQLRQLIDRSIVLTTLNSTTPSLINTALGVANCRNLQLVINVGAITTTSPALQLQGSDDNGASWYNLGTPLTAVASSTVQVTLTNVSTGLLRAIVSTAGVGVTAGYVLLRGF